MIKHCKRYKITSQNHNAVSYYSLQTQAAVLHTCSSHHRSVSRSGCNLKMHVQNLGCPLPLNIGALNHLFSTFFRRLCKLMALFNGEYSRIKTDIDNRRMAVERTKL